MLKFSLIINDQQVDGFKLNTSADSEKELEFLKELTSQLISKIVNIEISVSNEQ